MKAPLSWLKDYVDINVPENELANRLVKAGFEIEEIIHPSDAYVGIIAVKILKMEKHPNADKLQICQVDAGGKTLQIVTAATNVHEGDVVALATDGAILPTGLHIVKGELRGVTSEGMFCGGEELKLTENDYAAAGVDGVFIFPNDVIPGTNINDYIGTNDTVFDVGVTANRPDCNSILGIAREIAAVLNSPLKDTFELPQIANNGDIEKELKVEVDDMELCPRYLAKILTDVTIKESPEWIKRRLRLVGLRPINNIVDITNYVLFDIGQPMHAFDYSYIKGNKIVVRRASEGEHIVTLDGTDNKLSSSNLVIANSDEPMAVAGIMGGEHSGISNSTQKVVFEFARFKRDNIRKSSRSLGLRSDSSARFEKGIDYVSQDYALIRTMQLALASGAGKFVSGVLDSYAKESEKLNLTVKKCKIDEILGINIPAETMLKILESLGFNVTLNDNVFNIIVPSYREDIVGANDIAEEIIRMYGYDNIESKPLDGKKLTMGGRDSTMTSIQKIKAYLSGFAGMSETFSYSFISPKFVSELKLEENDKRRNVIEILNPLGEDVSVMRTTLVPSMISIAEMNYSRGEKAARLYEIGKVYMPKSLPITDTAIETETLVMSTFGEGEDFYKLKQVFEGLCDKFNIVAEFDPSNETYLHPYRQANIIVGNKKIGVIGQVLPSILRPYKFETALYVLEINLDIFIKESKDFLPFIPVSKFPTIERDLAFVVDENVLGKDMINLIKATGGAYLKSVEIFDVYRGTGVPEGKKSVAINMIFRKDEGTLDSEEVAKNVENILKEMDQRFDAKLRA